MWRTVIVLGCTFGTIFATPIGLKKNMEIMTEENSPEPMSAEMQAKEKSEMAMTTLNLPSNATSIRADIIDGFSCKNKTYGYYADVENDCQIFHVCMPVVYADGKENTFRWSFICPEETVFSQDSFTCMREEDMSFGCEDSVKYYELNRNFGVVDSSMEISSNEVDMNSENTMRDAGFSDIIPSEQMLDDDQEIIEKVEVIKPLPTKTAKPNKRKSPVRKSQIRKTTTTTVATPTTVTTPVPTTAKPLESETTPSKLLEKTTMKYQRFTRRPDVIKDNKKKTEIPESTTSPLLIIKNSKKPLKTETITQKRKRPQIQSSLKHKIILNDEKPLKEILKQSDVMKITPTQDEIIQSTVAKKDEIKLPLPTLIRVHEEPATTKKPEIIDDDKKVTTVSSTVIENEKEIPGILLSTTILPNFDNEKTTIIPMEVISVTATTTPTVVISNENIPEEIHEENEQKLNNEESMPLKDVTEDNTKNDDITEINEDADVGGSNNVDQQSMIINLISSLVNAENTKTDEDKIDNSQYVISEHEDKKEKNNLIPEVHEQQNAMYDMVITTTTEPFIFVGQNDQIINSEHDALPTAIEIKDHQPALNNQDIFMPVESQHEMYTHMTHIPVKLLSEDQIHNMDMSKSDAISVIQRIEELLQSDNLKEEEKINNSPETENINDKINFEIPMQPEKEEEHITAEKFTPEESRPILEIVPLESADQSEEIKPIFHRVNEPELNLLKPETIQVDEKQPIETSSLDSKTPEILSDLTETEKNISAKITPAEKVESNEAPQDKSINQEKLVVLSDKSLSARSLRKRVDPRKRRFLFRADVS